MLLDIAPTLAMYEGTTEAFARAYWHWFLLIQPAPLPERWIESDPVFYLRSVMGRRHAGLAAFDPEALAEYERCIAHPGSARARSARTTGPRAGIDLEHDRADRDGRPACRIARCACSGPRMAQSAPASTCSALWRERPRATSAGRPLDCGHYIAEERPAELLAEIDAFFKED